MCRCTLAAPFSSSSRFSSLYSFASGLPGATAGPPPCIFCERMEHTSTMQFGTRPEARHLMSKNFSAPMSDPKPASVHTKPCPERHLADAVSPPFFAHFTPIFSQICARFLRLGPGSRKARKNGTKRPRTSPERPVNGRYAFQAAKRRRNEPVGPLELATSVFGVRTWDLEGVRSSMCAIDWFLVSEASSACGSR